jgi:hypothetical protein
VEDVQRLTTPGGAVDDGASRESACDVHVDLLSGSEAPCLMVQAYTFGVRCQEVGPVQIPCIWSKSLWASLSE